MEFKTTKIILDKERQLKLTFRGINEFQQVTGIDILTLDDLRDLSPKEMIALIWACLIWEDKELKLESIPAMIEKIDATDLVNPLLECIMNSLPEVKPDAVPLPQKQESTGSIPGRLPLTVSPSIKTLSGD